MKKKSNINIRIDDDLLKQIDRIQMEHFFSSRSDTIRFLANYGIKYLDLADTLINNDAKQRGDDGEKSYEKKEMNHLKELSQMIFHEISTSIQKTINISPLSKNPIIPSFTFIDFNLLN